MNPFVFNVRTLAAPQSGVQRYVRELDSRLDIGVERASPESRPQGVEGHLWEQTILPVQCRGRLLFSPGNTGPLAYKRQVVTIHDTSTFDCPDGFTGGFGAWYRWLLPRLARRVLGVITVSEFSRGRIVETLGIARERVAVVHNGVTPAQRALPVGRLTEIRARLRLPKRFLLFVGSWDSRKNIERLLGAYSSAPVGKLGLVLAGGTNERLYSGSAHVADLPGVHVLGHVNDEILDALYSMAEGFVFPSLYEGFGLPPLEAMARGCPVLCSDSTCMPEVCGPSLEEGGAPLYFRADSRDSIADALVRFDRLGVEERARMSAAGVRRAAEFTWERCAARTLQALATFADQPRPFPAKGAGADRLVGGAGGVSP